MRVLKYTSLPWKTLETFTEERYSSILYGFRLSGAHDYFEFFTEDESQLVYWIENLSKVCINRDIREDFTLLNEIGQGKFSKVYKAKDKLTNANAAVKTITKSRLITNQQSLDAVLNEISFLRSLKHRLIAGLQKVYEDSEKVYLVLDYAQGGDVTTRLLRTARYSEQAARSILQQLVELLIYFRDQGVICRNLVASNLLLVSKQDHSIIKLCGFGRSMVTESNRFGAYAGTVRQLPSDSQESPQDDLRALGILLNQLLTGRQTRGGFENFYGQAPTISAQANELIRQLNSRDIISAEEILESEWMQPVVQQGERQSRQRQELNPLQFLKTVMSPTDFQKYQAILGEEDELPLALDEVSSSNHCPHFTIKSPGSVLAARARADSQLT